MSLSLRPTKPAEGRRRVLIEEISPQVDAGRYPVKRIVGDTVAITAAFFADGHDHVSGRLLYRSDSDRRWRQATMTPLGNDLYTASFVVDELGMWRFTVQAWIDHFDTWYSDLRKRIDGQPDPLHPDAVTTPQNIPLALRSGALLLEETAARAKGADAKLLQQVVLSLRWLADQDAPHYDFPLGPEIVEVASRYPDLSFATKYEQELEIWVDRERARFSSWYELFPRSASPHPLHHGTLADVEALLPSIAEMGFDILYLPPVHPIGKAFRKGPNNNVIAAEADEGSPWAIGAPEGGHKAVHSKLGTLADLERLAIACTARDMDLAMDIAFQCSPDHPWVKEHPDWFILRPDGSIQYAENPPKKYQDIYPLNFESPDWRGLWEELLSVFQFWIKHGVTVFRVDNPHTKALPFWEWVIGQIRRDHPEALFLAEAFTRPHVMYSLAKAGFTESYTYFTWRTESAELRLYLEEITRPPVSDFFRPNFWPNTPDILHGSLQTGGRPMFMQRVILAATLTANYGIYGPAFELGENAPMKPGSEEYLNSEKYEIRAWDRTASHSIAPLISKLNAIRRANTALQTNERLAFHDVDNPHLLCYSKTTADGSNIILVAVNLDPTQEQGGWIDLDLKALAVPRCENFDVEDLLTGQHYTWHDRSNYVALRPDVMPAHVFRLTAKA
jgi:starch synthase (maltosyl-transferring)